MQGNKRNRYVGSQDGINREVRDLMYRGNITNHTRKNFYKENHVCHECRKQEVVINLRQVNENSYMEGDRVIGV